MKKFLANLNGDTSGHIIIDSEYFTWKPMMLTKILSFGQAHEIKIPIKFIEIYKISRSFTWKFLHIGIVGEEQAIGFEVSNPARIVEELKKYNPYIHMYE